MGGQYRPQGYTGQPSGLAEENGRVCSGEQDHRTVDSFAPRNNFSVEEVRPGYVRAKIRLKGNKNHFGSLYAGAYFLVAEIPGGVLTLFDLGPSYTPILKEMTLQFLQPANSDVTVEFTLDPETVAAILADADETGRAKFSLEGKLVDEEGNHVATSIAHYRVRKKGFKAEA